MTQSSAADRKSVREAEKEARVLEAQRKVVVTNLMSSTSGREFVWNILDDCAVFTNTFTGTALTSAFNEGRRSVGLALLNTILLACPDQYIQAQREANDRSISAAGAAERRRGPIDNGRDSGTGPDRGSGRSGEASDNDGYLDVEFEPGQDLDGFVH